MLPGFPLFLHFAGKVFGDAFGRLVVTDAFAFVPALREKSGARIKSKALEGKYGEKNRKRVFRHDVVEYRVVSLEIRELQLFGNLLSRPS